MATLRPRMTALRADGRPWIAAPASYKANARAALDALAVAGWTAPELSIVLGVSPNTLKAWRSSPRAKGRAIAPGDPSALAELAGLPVDLLVYGDPSAVAAHLADRPPAHHADRLTGRPPILYSGHPQ